VHARTASNSLASNAGLLVLALVLACPRLGAAEYGASTSEYRIKAVFLFNFTQFVEWPSSAFSDSGSPMVIGILGNDPFGAFIDQVVQGELVNNRPVTVRRLKGTEDVTGCNILYVCQSEEGNMRNVLTAVKGRPILTVSDAGGFSHDGGMIGFFEEDHRIRLKINNREALADGLKISSKLLRPSQIVTSTGE
jgi:hypothetical protein